MTTSGSKTMYIAYFKNVLNEHEFFIAFRK